MRLESPLFKCQDQSLYLAISMDSQQNTLDKQKCMVNSPYISNIQYTVYTIRNDILLKRRTIAHCYQEHEETKHHLFRLTIATCDPNPKTRASRLISNIEAKATVSCPLKLLSEEIKNQMLQIWYMLDHAGIWYDAVVYVHPTQNACRQF